MKKYSTSLKTLLVALALVLALLPQRAEAAGVPSTHLETPV